MTEDSRAPTSDSWFDNPFIKDRLQAGVLTKYPSDASCRIVWTKGNISEVPPEGNHRCDLWKYDTVVFVWMDPRRLPIIFSRHFISADALPLSVTLDLTVQPKAESDSLRSIALNFDEKRDVIATSASAFLHERCRALNRTNVKASEGDLAAGLRKHLEDETGTLGLPFVFLKAMLRIDCPSLESVLEKRTQADIDHELDMEQEAHTHEIELIKAGNYLAMLNAQTESIALEQKRLLDSERTQEAIERGKLEVVLPLKDMSPEMLIVAMAQKPEIGKLLAEIQRVRATNDLPLVMELLKALGAATVDFRTPGAGVNMFTQK